MKKKEIIPVAFASSDAYSPYLGVALYSLIKHSNPVHEYHIYILFNDLTVEHQKRLKDLETDHVHIFFLDVTPYLNQLTGFQQRENHTIVVVFRLFASALLNKYEKIIYLDSDTVIMSDVYELYEQNVDDCIFMVGDPSRTTYVELHCRDVLKVEPELCLNSGVLVINTALFIKYEIREQCIALLQEDWAKENPKFIYLDQDVLTIVIRKYPNLIQHFPMEWNLECTHENPVDEDSIYHLTPPCKARYDIAKKSPKLLHYIGTKPWSTPTEPFADFFWSYAKETVFYEEILIKETKPKPRKVKKILYPFPWSMAKAGSTIVIYGAGCMGRSYLKQISEASYCFVAGICDQNASNMTDVTFPLIIPERLPSLDFQHIFIAIYDSEIAQGVREKLLEQGIPDEKIKWCDYT